MAKQSKNMIKYIIKRILMMIPMLLLVLAITFVLSNVMRASPGANQTMTVMTPEQMAAEIERIQAQEPWFVQLFAYYRNFFTGDWGQSYIGNLAGKPVLQIISEIFPKTIELMIVPIVVVPFIAIKLGVTSAKHKNKVKDTAIRFIAILGAGFPVFWIATLMQLFFGYYLGIFTMGEFDLSVFGSNSPGMGLPGPPGVPLTGFRIIDSFLYNDQMHLWDTLIHLIVPSICMILVSLSGITRQTRSSMLDVLDQDYIRTARAKGVLEKDVINKHALRNALLPTSNLIIGGTAAALLGSLFVEISFNYTGFGYYMVTSIFYGDYLVINGLLVFATIIILTSTLIADVAYTIIDPRIVYT
ncbi:MAG: ABC transporter permease [Promethearchaeota archaeon]